MVRTNPLEREVGGVEEDGGSEGKEGREVVVGRE